MNEIEEVIYKDLMYTQKAYFSGEQIHPNWEYIFALIVSGFLITYFTATSLGFPEKVVITIVGILLSASWFCLVSRNYLYAKVRTERMRELEEAIRRKISDGEPQEKPVVELFNLIERQDKYIKEQRKPWNKIGTWYIRKFLPFCLLIIWIVMMIYTIVC